MTGTSQESTFFNFASCEPLNLGDTNDIRESYGKNAMVALV